MCLRVTIVDCLYIPSSHKVQDPVITLEVRKHMRHVVFLVLSLILFTYKRRVSRCYIKTKKIWAVKRQLGDGFVTLNCLYTTIFQLVSQQKSFIMSRLQNLCQLIAEAVMDVKPHACEYINAVYEEKHHLVIKLFGFEICPRGSCHSCKL